MQDGISLKVSEEAVKVTGSSVHDRASKQLAAMEDQIKVNPAVLHKFLSVLRGDPSLVYIADAMSDHYRKCSSIALYLCSYTCYNMKLYPLNNRMQSTKIFIVDIFTAGYYVLGSQDHCCCQSKLPLLLPHALVNCLLN